MLQRESDERLMAKYRLGDEDAFAILYERHSGKVYAYLRAKTASDSLARDIFQAVFLKLHASRGRYRTDLPFLPWLFAIARNELIDTMRKRSRNLEDATEWLPEFAEPEKEEPAPVVHLHQLPDSQRRAIQMRYDEELPFEKIADRIGTSDQNARQLVSRGIKALRRIYGKK